MIVSEEFYRIFEFDPAAPVTLERIGARVHREDISLFHESIGRARRADGDFEQDFRLQMFDGSVKYVHVAARATADCEGAWEYVGAIQDVTQRRLLEDALSKTRAELIHVARVTTLGTLTASITHEVTQPIAGIITNASTCLLMLAADPPDLEGARDTARRTIRDGHRASELITRLRALFSKDSVATESLDLNETAREALTLSSSELQRRRAVVRTEWADHLPPIQGDRVQLQQVILNLLLNAAEAMHGVDDRPRQLVLKTALDEDHRACLSVQDAGMGFCHEAVERIFEPFYTTKPAGTGLGLAVSRELMRSQGGDVQHVASETGARFVVQLPKSPPESPRNLHVELNHIGS